MNPTRRGFLRGLLSALAAPAIVRPEILMPVRSIIIPSPDDLLDIGNLPDNAQLTEQLTAITRRAFVPRLIVQLYKQTPMLSELIGEMQQQRTNPSYLATF